MEARPEKELEEQEKMKEEEDGGCFRAPQALIAEENANAEYLIGLEESPQDCSVAKLASFRAKLRLLSEHGSKLTAAARRQAQAAEAPDAQMELAADAAAVSADHRSACVDLRVLAKRMGSSFQELRELRRCSCGKVSKPLLSQELLPRRG